MKHTPFIAACAGIGFLAAPAASASQTLPYVHLQCRGAEVMVRFEFGDDLAPLPAPAAERWKGVALAGKDGCRLASGETVVVLQGDQQTSNGADGGDPPGFFSLWVGGKKLIAREFYKGGYGAYGLIDNSILYSAGSLTRCTYPQATMEYADLGALKCASTAVDFASLPVDPLAPTPEMMANLGKFSVVSTSSEGFCRGFVKPTSYALQEPRDPGMLYIAEKEVLAPPPGTEFPMSDSGKDADNPFDGSGEWVPNASAAFRYKLVQFDFTNSGKPQTVLRLWGDDLSLMGDVYLHWNGIAPQSAIDAVLKALPWTYEWKAFLRGGPWTAAFGVPQEQFPRIYGMPLRIAGVTYFFQRNYNVEAAPSAQLYRMTAKKPELMCTFQVLQPAF